MAANTIQLDGDYKLEEAIAEEIIKPGMLIEKISTGKVQKHSTDNGHAQVAIAVEDGLQGNTITDNYAAAALVIYHIMPRGTRFQGILVAAGTAVVVGGQLVSDGAGRLQAVADGSGTEKQIIAYAEEAVDLTGSGAVDTLIACRAA